MESGGDVVGDDGFAVGGRVGRGFVDGEGGIFTSLSILENGQGSSFCSIISLLPSGWTIVEVFL